jgi:lysophospholipase L1-like esterase
MNKLVSWFKDLIKLQLLTVRRGFITLFLFLAFIPLIITIIYSWMFVIHNFSLDTVTSIVIAITLVYFTTCLVFLIFADISFRFLYLLIRGQRYIPQYRAKSKDLYAKPHPYVPYVYKPHFKTLENAIPNYPLHKEKFTYSNLITNNLGFANGPNGDRDVSMDKPINQYRINCLGASTTGNYITQGNKNYSYPLELETLLNEAYRQEVEVNNFGLGGYNSADILVRFLFEIVETDPDMVIIYHGHNDIKSYLTPDFKHDYSHSKINLGENYWKFQIGEKMPFLPFHFINFIVEKWFPIGVRNSLLDFVSKGKIDLNIDPKQGLEVYRRNLEYLIEICKSKGIKVVLSTYAHFLHNNIKNSELHKKYSEIISKENAIIRDLSKRHKLTIVDNANLIPAEEKYFLDSVHFTPEGMKLLANNIAKSLKYHLDQELVSCSLFDEQ